MRVSLALVSICSLLAVAPDGVTAWLAFDREAILMGQVWRCWTGHLVHFSLQHALPDIVVLFVATRILETYSGSRAAAWAFFLGAPLISLGLLVAVADLRLYEGASGLATLIGVAAGCQLWRADHRLRGVLGLLAAAVLIKLVLDASGSLPDLTTLPEGVQVAWQAHAIGAILGLLSAIYESMRPGAHCVA
jgi:rhomboid family GlyGly-CTERM serine protease